MEKREDTQHTTVAQTHDSWPRTTRHRSSKLHQLEHYCNNSTGKDHARQVTGLRSHLQPVIGLADLMDAGMDHIGHGPAQHQNEEEHSKHGAVVPPGCKAGSGGATHA